MKISRFNSTQKAKEKEYTLSGFEILFKNIIFGIGKIKPKYSSQKFYNKHIYLYDSKYYKSILTSKSITINEDTSRILKTSDFYFNGDSYFEKVKMIYIDPPYNTGNKEFIYDDDFSDNIKNYLSTQKMVSE